MRSQENGNRIKRTQTVHRLGDGEGGYDHHVGTVELEAKGWRETGETSTCLPCMAWHLSQPLCLHWLGRSKSWSPLPAMRPRVHPQLAVYPLTTRAVLVAGCT